MYLTAVIDWFSREIFGWTLSDALDAKPVMGVVQNAVESCVIPAILNSGKGSQFTSDKYKQLRKELHIRQSMDGKSRRADNIMIERWFRRLKTELIYFKEYRSPKELRRAIHSYIDDYNTLSPHEALNYATPEETYKTSFTATRAV